MSDFNTDSGQNLPPPGQPFLPPTQPAYTPPAVGAAHSPNYSGANTTELVAEPGDVTSLPSGHDAWVIGGEPAVMVDWFGASNYAKNA